MMGLLGLNDETRLTVEKLMGDVRKKKDAPVNLRKTIKTWFLSLIHLRLGVDRRKEVDRRKNGARRQQRNGSVLTREELADLLS